MIYDHLNLINQRATSFTIFGIIFTLSSYVDHLRLQPPSLRGLIVSRTPTSRWRRLT